MIFSIYTGREQTRFFAEENKWKARKPFREMRARHTIETRGSRRNLAGVSSPTFRFPHGSLSMRDRDEDHAQIRTAEVDRARGKSARRRALNAAFTGLRKATNGTFEMQFVNNKARDANGRNSRSETKTLSHFSNAPKEAKMINYILLCTVNRYAVCSKFICNSV